MFIYKYTHIIQSIISYNNFNIGSSMACRLEYLSHQHLHYFLQAAKMGPCLHQILKKSKKTPTFIYSQTENCKGKGKVMLTFVFCI